ncbi:MAG: hypothetical protein ACJAYU_001626 [Bradymonadia bacterium]|jgi:hypothetical protein
MSAERPLDALLPQLKDPARPTQDVHPRVLETVTDAGREWILLVWADPGGAQALHSQVQALVEATLLSELSRSAATIRNAGERRFVGIRLISFVELSWDPSPALQAFGFQPESTELSDEVSAAVAAEASRSGRAIEGPNAVWRAAIAHPEGALGEKLESVDKMMATRLGDDIWGASPGGPSHLFATYVVKTFGEQIRPDRAGMDSLDLLVVQRTPGVIRWIPPLIFQAVCDFIPVVAATQHDAKISWAESEELGNGFAHPPLFRVDDGKEGIHIPVGHHVMRWWMMPLAEGEAVPTIADWVEDQFGGK